MLQLRVQEVGEYEQPEAIMTAARAVRHACMHALWVSHIQCKDEVVFLALQVLLTLMLSR